jgi:hypothetical protein
MAIVLCDWGGLITFAGVVSVSIQLAAVVIVVDFELGRFT